MENFDHDDPKYDMPSKTDSTLDEFCPTCEEEIRLMPGMTFDSLKEGRILQILRTSRLF